MPIRYSNSGGGIPFGDNSLRPASPGIGKLYSNGEAQRLELYTSTGWQNIVSETPGVVSILGQYLESNTSNQIEITGTNFVTGAIASAIGTNGVEVQAGSTTVNSIVSVSAVFSGLSSAYEPYDIKVTNTSNLFGILPDALYINQSPIWQTPSGSLGTFDEEVSISLSATALDADSTVTYQLADGSSLPSGVSLNQTTGQITGTLPKVNTDTTYSFTVNATDGANIIPRTFSITSIRVLTIEYLVVAGGGAGGDFFTGSGYNAAGGGGGAGGYIHSTSTLKASSFSFPISVGAAGVSTATSNSSGGFASNGGNSSFNGLTAIGGGRGAAGNSSVSANVYTASSGGSGGGGSRPDGGPQFASGALGTSGQGFAGGNCNTSGNDGDGGGGGGATSAGTNGGVGSQGGAGYTSSITGTSVIYAAGGGGGDGLVGSWVGSGGSGVGGNGGVKQNYSPGGNASSFGSGGGGAGSSFSDTSQFSKGGNGSGGVVILAYPDTEPALVIPGTLTYDQPTRSGYRVYRFTSGSGTVTL